MKFISRHQLVRRTFVALSLTLCASSVIHAQTTWEGDFPNGKAEWDKSQNWSNGVPTSSTTAIFSSVGVNDSTTPTITTSNTPVLGLQFNAVTNPPSFVIGGTGSLTIGSTTNSTGIVNNSTANQTFNVPITLAISQTWSANSGNLTFGSTAPITNGGNRLTLNAATNQTITVSGNITGTGGLTKSGAGKVLLNSTTGTGFTGTTIINGGTLEVASTNGLGSTSGIQVNNSGSTLLLTGTSTNRISNTAPITLGGGQIEINGNNLSETLGALTLTTNSSLDFFGTGSSLNFASLSSTTPTTLSIYNWSSGSDQLILGSAPSNVTVTFYSGPENAPGTGFSGVYNPSTGQMNAVPEPSTIIAGLGLVAFLGWRERRRISALIKRDQHEESLMAA